MPATHAAFPGVKPPAGAVNPYTSNTGKSPTPKYLPTDPAASDSYYISSPGNTDVTSAASPSPAAAPSTASPSSSPAAPSAATSSALYVYSEGLQGSFFDASWYTQVCPLLGLLCFGCAAVPVAGALAAPACLPVTEFRQLPLGSQRARAGSSVTLVFAQLRRA